MANSKFDSKSFNAEAFLYKQGRIPNLKMKEIVKSRAVVGDSEVKKVFSSQDGAAYARLAVKGLLDGDALNYDGATDITATSTKTFEQGYVVVGRAKAWVEKDFSDDISGQSFMDNVIAQTAEYWDGINTDIILSALAGAFNMTGTKNLEFVNGHTYDITDATESVVGATTLNTAMNQACKANKKKFSLVFVHPDVATNLENLNLINYLKYTDADGITRDLELGTWNGRMVIVTDEVPTTAVEASGDDPAHTEYTTYILGNGAITFEDVGCKVPAEMDRNPATAGGQDVLYNRERKALGLFGISYEKASQSTNSPTNTELATGSNWALVHSGETVAANRTYIDHKAIPIARIISRG